MQKTTPERYRETVATAPTAPAPTIAVRKSCDPDGVGLSHYVLMDREKTR